MHEIIDVPSSVEAVASQLAAGGVKTVIRYYNHENSQRLPSKCLTVSELRALHAAGLSVAAVFEQRAGAGGIIADLTAASGEADARRALALASELSQPAGSAIYFAVDWDFVERAELDSIAAYFTAARSAIGGRHAIGVYGSGMVGRRLKGAGLVDHIWLAGSMGWSGTRSVLADGSWTLFQQQLDLHSPIGGFGYDGNTVNPAFTGFGQFGPDGPLETPAGVATAALYRVIARSGLHLRAGPGDGFPVLDTLPPDTIVRGLGREGAWIKTDVQGDGQADGFMFETFLQLVSGGLPLPLPAGTQAAAREPIDVARDELALDVREVPGAGNNPRIVMYHATTRGGAAPDSTPWCSSFVNYCVEQAGLHGTDSKAALSWHEQGWGQEVTAAPAPGDIAVFRRSGASGSGGHVGFFVGDAGDSVRVLGGNQGNRVSIAPFPRDGVVDGTRYTLLSVRRG